MKGTKIKYYNIWERIEQYPGYNFYIAIGARGPGKTYGALSGLYDRDYKFVYTRLNKNQLSLSCTPKFNPYKKINENRGIDVRIEKGEPPVIVEYRDGKPFRELGYGVDVSTNGNVRGADMTDIKVMLYDEFTRDPNTRRTLKDEATPFFNLYETISRNREIEGEEPLLCILLSNANTLDNDILRSFGLVDKIMEIKTQHPEQNIFLDDDKGIFVELIDMPEFREMKKNTAIYRATRGTQFYEMALNNEFTYDYFGDVKQIDYRELTPLVHYNKIYFYKHKVKNLLYISYRKSECPGFNDNNKKLFMQSWGFRINMLICAGLVVYQNYSIKMDCRHLLDNDAI